MGFSFFIFTFSYHLIDEILSSVFHQWAATAAFWVCFDHDSRSNGKWVIWHVLLFSIYQSL